MAQNPNIEKSIPIKKIKYGFQLLDNNSAYLIWLGHSNSILIMNLSFFTEED